MKSDGGQVTARGHSAAHSVTTPTMHIALVIIIMLPIYYLRQMLLPAFVCLSACLFVCLSVSKITQNACMDLDEMLRVDRCLDMDELINF